MLDKDSLLSRVKDELLLHRHDATSESESKRNLALRILFNQMERMPDAMVPKAIGRLGEIGALEVTAATETLVPEHQTLMDAIQEALGHFRRGSQPSSGTSNPVKDTGLLLEAIEHETSK
jgi:hypothetical protein